MSNFDSNGNYNKTEWKDDDLITADKLNKIEDAIQTVNKNDIERYKEVHDRLDVVEGELEEVSTQLADSTNKINNGIVYIKDFNGTSSDDNVIIQNAFDFAKNNFENYTIIFENREYRVNKKIDNIGGSNITINGNNARIYLYQNPSTKWYEFISCSDLTSFRCYNLSIDGKNYGVHYNDEQGLKVFSVSAIRVDINNCHLTNIYGSGINVSGIVNIHDNYIHNCSGVNYGQHNSGAYDNYGDGIRVSNEISKVGKVYNNYIVIDDDRKGRAGIVLEFNATNIELSSNYISGYNVGVHLELVENNIVRENTINKSRCGIILANAPFSKIYGNKVYQHLDKGGLYLNTCLYLYKNYTNTDIYDNHFIGDNKTCLTTGNGGNIRVKGNIFDGMIELNNIENVTFIENIFNRNEEHSTNMLQGYATKNITLKNNTFNDYRLSFSGGESINIDDNVFNSTVLPEFIKVVNKGSYNIKNNRFNISNTITHLIHSYVPTRIGEFSNNIIYNNEPVKIFEYGSTSAHQAYITKSENIQITSDNTIIKIDDSYKSNIVYNESLKLYDSNSVKYEIIVNTDGTIATKKI